MLTAQQIRKIYFDHWTSSPRSHAEIQNSSLVPIGDSTILFVNSGMFPLVPYLSGEPHPLGKRLVNFQRSLRTDNESISEIGDNRHTLMFEMMGNWSLGDYFKADQLPWAMELFHEKFGLDIQRLYVSVFAGDDAAPRDEESIEIWKKVYAKYGIEALVSDNPQDVQKNFDEQGNLIDPKRSYRIFTYPAKKNWWQRGQAPGELGGPDSEVFYDLGIKAEAYPDPDLHINGDNGRFVEIGNSVFIQFKLDQNLKWEQLIQKNVDFGGGFERVVMCVQDKTDIFETDLYQPIIDEISTLTKHSYKDSGKDTNYTKYYRILADHARAASFIIADGVKPGNKDQGYILRRLIRRMVRNGLQLEINANFTKLLALKVVEIMQEAYPHLVDQQEIIVQELTNEEDKFRQTLANGLRELQKVKAQHDKIDGTKLFDIFETHGFPLELALEELGINDEEVVADLEKQFNTAFEEHRTSSRAGAEQKFKGGLADHSAEVIKLHTAHHLLLKALQIVLGDEVKQRGSNITGERLRIDFNYNEKLTTEQLSRVEEIVNQKIAENLPVTRVEMNLSDADKIGAQMEFGQKYPPRVSVYFIGGNPEQLNTDPAKAGNESDVFSKEFCGGPHVTQTGELGKFKIVKEESSSSGIRRIKAVLQ